MTTINEMLLGKVLPTLRDHDIALHGRTNEEGLVSKVENIRKLIWMGVGIIGFLNLIIIILTFKNLLK